MLTLAKIAKEIGVCKSTVSLVLNGRAKEMRISDETVRKVQEYCEKVNYLPSIHARRMRQDIVRNLMVFFNVSDPTSPESTFADYNTDLILGGITEVADREGFSTTIRLYRPGMDARLIFDCFRNRAIDGLIYYGMDMPERWREMFVREKRRVVGIGIEPGMIPSVNIDNYGISKELTGRLLAQGRRKFLFLSGTEVSYPGQERERGFLDALHEAGVAFDAETGCRRCFFEEEPAYRFVRGLDRAAMPEAFVCANDKMALGVLRALHEAGVSVPGETAVAGGDNINLAAYVTPGLTTFENRPAEQGAAACRMLLSMIGGERQGETVTLPSALALRESA